MSIDRQLFIDCKTVRGWRMFVAGYPPSKQRSDTLAEIDAALAAQSVAQTGVPEAVEKLEILASFAPQYIGSVACDGSASGVVTHRILEQINEIMALLIGTSNKENKP